MVRTLGRASALVLLPAVLFAQDNDPPSRAGRVSSVAGTVGFQAGGTPDWSLAPLNYTVTSGDRLLTHQRSRAEIEVGPFDVRLADSTDLSVVNLTDDFTQLGLTRGTIRVSVYRLASRDSMEVDTPNGAIIIRSAGKYRIDVLEGVSTLVSVEDGVVELSGPSLDYTVRRGQTVELTGTTAISANMVPHPRSSEFDQWSADRDRRQQSASYSQYMSRDIPGGADLDRYGRWHYHASYGYVWQPTIVTVGWVPYRHGRWVWSGPWGWTWVEDAPWGYAPFHYGRWVVIGNSWVWAPGPIVRRPCYAPALVVFVGGPRYGRHHQAWFPLGWDEPYYPRYRHSDRYLRTVNIANVRNVSNVDEFVDVRRADRIKYANRQATTVVNGEEFGRRPVTHLATNVRRDEIAQAPIIRDRWETPRLASRESQPSARVEDRPTVFRPRREATAPIAAPVREVEPRAAEPQPQPRSPLIYRNAPPIGRRAAGVEQPQTREPSSEGTGIARPRRTLEPSPEAPGTIDRGRSVIRRTGASQLPQGAEPSERSLPRRSEPSRATPRESAPPRQSAPPREVSAPPRESAPRGRVASPSSGGSSRLPSRRPPGE